LVGFPGLQTRRTKQQNGTGGGHGRIRDAESTGGYIFAKEAKTPVLHVERLAIGRTPQDRGFFGSLDGRPKRSSRSGAFTGPDGLTIAADRAFELFRSFVGIGDALIGANVDAPVRAAGLLIATG
jgi:hypothetical protein